MIQHWIVIPTGAKVWSFRTALRYAAGLPRSHLDVDGQAAAYRIRPVYGPASEHMFDWTSPLVPPMAAGSERQLVAVTKNKVVLHMERRKAPLGRKIFAVVNGKAGGPGDLFRPLDSGSSSIIDVARPGIGSIECQTGARTSLHDQLESVINLIGNGSDVAKRSVIGVGYLRIRRSELPAVSNDCRFLIRIVNRKQIHAACSHVIRFDHQSLPNLPLQRKRPLQGVGSRNLQWQH